MTITSTAFQNNEHIPKDYTCDGENINPPLTFSEIPQEAESLVLVVDDPDAPGGTFTHWLIYDMSPGTLQILQRSGPPTGKVGTNDFKIAGYGGPCPPTGVHRYYFTLHALSARPHLHEGATRTEVDTAIAGHILESAQLVGLYEKPTEPSKTLADQDKEDYTDDRNTSDGQVTTTQQANWQPRRSHLMPGAQLVQEMYRRYCL